jgi:uncharacterized protein YbjQ (UPF0145 family)
VVGPAFATAGMTFTATSVADLVMSGPHRRPSLRSYDIRLGGDRSWAVAVGSVGDREGRTMIIVNTDNVEGRSIVSVHGLVMGNTIRSKNVGKDIGAGLKNLVGGELRSYTAMLTEARQEALDRMVESAEAMNADAVVNVRFTTSQIAGGAAELLAYGTAVSLT